MSAYRIDPWEHVVHWFGDYREGEYPLPVHRSACAYSHVVLLNAPYFNHTQASVMSPILIHILNRSLAARTRQVTGGSEEV